MNRRNFLIHLLRGLHTMALVNLLPPAELLAAAKGKTSSGLHYRPLEGASLRDIALRKLHHGKNRFLNPIGMPRKGRFLQLLRWKLFNFNRFGKDLDAQPLTPVSLDWRPVADHPGPSVTFLKHAGIMISDRGRHLIIDPVFDDIFWFIKDFSPLASDIRKMPRPDHVLITHGHYDHLDLPSLRMLAQDAHTISPLGYGREFRRLGGGLRTQLDWYDAHDDAHWAITLLPCNHWTMRNPAEGPNTSLWGSYLIRSADGFTVYVSGDTAFFDGFEQIGREFDIDLAIFNLGAYEPRWFMAPSHLNPRETVQAFKALNAKRLMIVHWGTFRLGDEPVHFPPLQIHKELETANLLDRWIDIKHGKTYFAG